MTKTTKSCAKCSLHKDCLTPCIPGRGQPSPLMIIGEAPGAEEDILEKPFVGKAGELLTWMFQRWRLHEGQVFITNVIRCRPVDNKLPRGKELDEVLKACRPYLEAEIRRIRPKVLLLLGATALYAMTGSKDLSQWHGRWPKRNMLVSYHPAYILRNPWEERRLAAAIWMAATRAGLATDWNPADKPFPYQQF